MNSHCLNGLNPRNSVLQIGTPASGCLSAREARANFAELRITNVSHAERGVPSVPTNGTERSRLQMLGPGPSESSLSEKPSTWTPGKATPVR